MKTSQSDHKRTVEPVISGEKARVNESKVLEAKDLGRGREIRNPNAREGE